MYRHLPLALSVNMFKLFLKKRKTAHHMLFAKLLTIIGKENIPIFKRFFIVGVLNTIVGYTIFGLLVYFEVYYLLSLTISHVLGTIHSYLWNKFFTFKSKNKIRKEVLKFATIYTFIYLVNFLLLFLAVNVFRLNVYLSQIAILGFVIITSFVLQQKWAFKSRE